LVHDIPGRVSYKYYLLSDEQMKQAKHKLAMNTPTANTAYHASDAVAGAASHRPPAGKTVIFTLGSRVYQVEGTGQTMDTASLIKNDRVYIQVRFMATAFGVLDKDILWGRKIADRYHSI
jgi:hypothetical protein